MSQEIPPLRPLKMKEAVQNYMEESGSVDESSFKVNEIMENRGYRWVSIKRTGNDTWTRLMMFMSRNGYVPAESQSEYIVFAHPEDKILKKHKKDDNMKAENYLERNL